MNLARLGQAGAGVHLWPPRGRRDASDLELFKLLPSNHQALLQATNGFEAFGGHFRLFGIGPDSGRDAATWNHEATWKFAWPPTLAELLCFGETSFGDQYAYRLSELRGASASATIYGLDGLEGQVQRTFKDFNDFLDQEVETWISGPKDDLVLLARETLGDVQAGEQLNFAPPLWLAPMASERLVRMPARTNMILNGDLYSQLSSAPEKQVARLEPWTDNAGRPRMKVVFAEKG